MTIHLRKKKQPKKITPTYLRNAGLYYLQRYAASKYQFERAMKRKIDRSCFIHKEQKPEECYEWLADVTKEFQELGYLNDEFYLRGMVRSLRLSKGLSTRMILMKLKEKGFKEQTVLEELSRLAAREKPDSSMHDQEMAAALQFALRKKLGPYHPDPPRKTYEQQLSALARGGFSYEICKKVMETSLSEWSGLPGHHL